MKKKQRNRYSKEFIGEVIEEWLKEGNVRSVAAKMGMPKSTAWDWKEQVEAVLRAMPAKKQLPRRTEDIRKIRQLRSCLKKAEKELKEARALLVLQKKSRICGRKRPMPRTRRATRCLRADRRSGTKWSASPRSLYPGGNR